MVYPLGSDLQLSHHGRGPDIVAHSLRTMLDWLLLDRVARWGGFIIQSRQTSPAFALISSCLFYD
jgi:hypothetical protein